jgi:transcriptional regulator with XRE-family HTH domain
MHPVPRKLSKPRPKQAARLIALRKAAGLSQTELAKALGVPQTTVAHWEVSEKPPRSDVLPLMAKVLGVDVDDILGGGQPPLAKSSGPVGRVQQVFEEVRRLPRRQQERVLDMVVGYIEQLKRKAG